MRSYRYLIGLEVESRRPPDEDRIESALEHSTAAEALSCALDAEVRLYAVYEGIDLARHDKQE